MSNQTPHNYSGQTFNQPIMVNGIVMTNPQIEIPRPPYLLERYDFDKLIKGEGLFLTLANTLLGAVIGLLINMFAKLIGSKIDTTIMFENWEIYAFIISLVIMIICYIIYYSVPNERKNIIKTVKEHFENS
jgi:hypothetical protein